jgi:serine/threonine protein kinase
LEYCTGGDLQSLLKQDGHIPEASVRIFALDLLAGLKVLDFLLTHTPFHISVVPPRDGFPPLRSPTKEYSH